VRQFWDGAVPAGEDRVRAGGRWRLRSRDLMRVQGTAPYMVAGFQRAAHSVPWLLRSSRGSVRTARVSVEYDSVTRRRVHACGWNSCRRRIAHDSRDLCAPLVSSLLERPVVRLVRCVEGSTQRRGPRSCATSYAYPSNFVGVIK